MKQRLLLLLLLGLLMRLGGHAQSTGRGLWCPPGAMWQHMSIFASLGMPSIVYTPVRTSYVGDTIIGGQSCQVLQVTNTRTPSIGRIYTRADADRVWVYAQGQFYKMHDFSAQPGDTWLFRGTAQLAFHCTAPIQLVVDSVGQRFIGGQTRRWFRVHYQRGIDVVRSERIYEGVGSFTGYLSPTSGICAPSDPVTALQAQCYGTAAQPGLIVLGTMLSCQAIPTATHAAQASAAGFEVYPTAGSGAVTVKLPASYSHATLRIFNPAGQLVHQLGPQAAAERPLQLGHLPHGLYLLRVQQPGLPGLSQRIVLQ